MRRSRSTSTYERAVGFSLGGEDEPLRAEGARASATLFTLLGARPALGRAFVPGDDRPGATPVAVLSDGLWRERFGADPNVVGRRIRVDGAERTVVGVMPRDFRFPAAGTRLWVPMLIDPANEGLHWGIVRYKMIARLAPGMTAGQARDDVRRVMRVVRNENPLWTQERWRTSTTATSCRCASSSSATCAACSSCCSARWASCCSSRA